MSKDNESLCLKIQQNSQKAIEELYQNNIKLIYSLLKRFHYLQSEKDDLLSCAKIGLINAAKKYDPSHNCLFSTYCVPLILGEIKKYFRDNSSLHVSRSYKDLYSLIMKTTLELESKYQKNISLYDVASYLSLPIEEILIAYEAHVDNLSLDDYVSDEKDISLSEVIGEIDDNEKNRDLNIALSKLEKKERLLIELRYFQGYTQQEVANRLFMSQVQVSRLEKKIIEKLKVLI